MFNVRKSQYVINQIVLILNDNHDEIEIGILTDRATDLYPLSCFYLALDKENE